MCDGWAGWIYAKVAKVHAAAHVGTDSWMLRSGQVEGNKTLKRQDGSTCIHGFAPSGKETCRVALSADIPGK